MTKRRVLDAYKIQKYIPGERIHVKSTKLKFHYTSPEGFLSIIKKSGLYFTDIRYFNDKSENTYIYHCFKKFLNKHHEQYNVLRELMSTLFPENEDINANFVNPKYPFVDKPKRIFVLCTCTDPDSLSMWNYYVKNGNYNGYSIGLNPTSIIKSFENKSDKIEVLFGNVIYNEKDQFTEIELIADLLEKHFAGKKNKLKGLAVLFSYFQNYSAFFKNEKFSHEKEYRFVISVDEDKLYDCLDKSLELDFRISNGIVVPYLALTIDKEAIKQVYLSPNTEVEISKKSIKELCCREKTFSAKCSTYTLR